MLDALVYFILIRYTASNFFHGQRFNKISNNFDSKIFLDEYRRNIDEHITSLDLNIPNLKNKDILIPYFKKLSNYVSKDELKLVCNRIETLKLKRSFMPFLNLANGTYSNYTNTINYGNKSSLGHEFLHMASSYFAKEIGLWLCGFEMVKGKLIIGEGLNEGFTELLASRLYNKKQKPSSYDHLVHICEMLELFFDNDDDMRKLYFSCDLPKFIEKMKEYMSEAEVYNLLYKMDLCTNNLIPIKELDIQAFLYKKFMDKCNDQNKIDKMNNIIKKNKMISVSILNKEKAEARMKVQSVKDVFKKTAKVYYSRAAIGAVATTSLFLLGKYNTNVKEPYSYAEALVNNCTEDDAFILNEEIFSLDQKTKMPVTSYDGKYLYKTIINNNLKYCDILDEYYTLNGGNITFNIYNASRKTYYSEANPIYYNDKIIAYAYVPNPELPTTTKYEVIDGKVFYIEEQLFNETILPDGTRITELDNNQISYYSDIELVDTQTFISKSYNEIIDYNLLCDAEKIPRVYSNGQKGTKWNLDYTLEHKKN